MRGELEDSVCVYVIIACFFVALGVCGAVYRRVSR